MKDYEKLMSSDGYKEKYRKDMIRWSEEIRDRDHGYFCRAAIEFYAAADKSAWIVSDCRRKSDLRLAEYRLGRIMVPRLREFSPRGQRELGGGIHAT